MSFFTSLAASFSSNRKPVQSLQTEDRITIRVSAVPATSDASEAPKEAFQGTTKEAEPSVSAVQPLSNENKIMNTSASLYASLTDAEKVASLEKAVYYQGEYLKAYKASMKLLNRRNTMAIIELQKVVIAAVALYPDLQAVTDPAMVKVTELLDFKKPYDL